MLALPAPALAGRVIATGHAPDVRCADDGRQCGFLFTAVQYVRETAPDPSKPVLAVGRGATLERALVRAWGGDPAGYGTAPAPPRAAMSPGSRAFRRAVLDPSRYSAIVIAADLSCRDCDAILGRRAAVQRFLNRGGGIVILAGARKQFRVLPLPARRRGSRGPFTLTPYGERIGFTPPEINCCRVHNTFADPPVGSTAIAAQNGRRSADTLIADGVVRRGRLVATETIPPVAGESIVVEPVRGRVLGHPPGDPRFRPITGAANLVIGWTLDVEDGVVRLTSAADQQSTRQSADLSQGIFQILQEAGPDPVTDLALRGGSFRACPSVGASQRKSRVVRQLFGKGRGRFRTVGKFATASVRGTEWLTQDRCDGTLVRVIEGLVEVFDRVLNRAVEVQAGRSYLARRR